MALHFTLLYNVRCNRFL